MTGLITSSTELLQANYRGRIGKSSLRAPPLGPDASLSNLSLSRSSAHFARHFFFRFRRESIRKLRILKLASCGGYRKLGISYFGGFKRGLITKTTIEFHPHGDVTVPCCGYQSDILCFDWRNQRIFYPGVLIIVSNKHLKISKIIIVLIDLSTRFLKLEWFIAK